MSARLARLALALYPLAYRRRYGEEMASLLEDEAPSPATIVDLLRGAARAHLRPEQAVAAEVGPDERLRLGVGSVLVCWALFVVAGLALYKTTENGASAAGGGEPGLLAGLHLSIQVLAALGSAAVVVGLLEVALSGRVLRLARACATAVVAAMIGIAVLTFAYLLTAVIAAPAFAGEPNGPLGLVSVATSLAILSVAMLVLCVPAAVGIRRAWRSGLLR